MPAPFKVISPRHYRKRDGSSQTQWITVGSAFPAAQGGFDCSLWCLPLPDNDNGEVRILIRPDDSEARRGQQGNAPQGERQNFGGTHRDQFRGNAAAAPYAGHAGQTQADEAYYPGKPDDKLPF